MMPAIFVFAHVSLVAMLYSQALDHQIVKGRGEQTALIHDSPVTGTKSRVTYNEMRDRVAKLAGALR